MKNLLFSLLVAMLAVSFVGCEGGLDRDTDSGIVDDNGTTGGNPDNGDDSDDGNNPDNGDGGEIPTDRIVLSESMISTNAPLLYKTWGYTPDSHWESSNKAITDEQAAMRLAAAGEFSNMWDGDLSTCYSTNYDIYVVGGSWATRDVVPNHYIQIDLGRSVKKLKVSITAAADPYYRLLNIEFKAKADNASSFTTMNWSYFYDNRKSYPDHVGLCTSNEVREFELPGPGSNFTGSFSSLRICATHGTTTAGGIELDSKNDNGCGYFGIAELVLEKIE